MQQMNNGCGQLPVFFAPVPLPHPMYTANRNNSSSNLPENEQRYSNPDLF